MRQAVDSMGEQGIHVAVLTCGPAAYETAGVIGRRPEVRRVTVVESAPARRGGLRARLRRLYRRQGAAGVVRAVLRRALPARVGADSSPPEHHIRVSSFHDEEGLGTLKALDADLFVVDGTYILEERVFTMPRLGTINLHCGYLPEFKGAPPVFWELFEGVRSTGVSVHFVTADLDGGPIIDRRRFPIDTAPEGDPVAYAERTWRRVLRPAGMRMLAEAVARIATKDVDAIPQCAGEGTVYRYPDRHEVRELRRRVAGRRESAP